MNNRFFLKYDKNGFPLYWLIQDDFTGKWEIGKRENKNSDLCFVVPNNLDLSKCHFKLSKALQKQITDILLSQPVKKQCILECLFADKYCKEIKECGYSSYNNKLLKTFCNNCNNCEHLKNSKCNQKMCCDVYQNIFYN